MENKKKIIVVLVTYKADTDLLRKCINSLKEQVSKIVIIDNTPSNNNKLKLEKIDNVEIIYLGDNYGIAYAQNIGIKKAIQCNADFILTSDQDTIYPDKYIKDLLECFTEKSINTKIASISPIFVDENKQNKLQPMVYFKNGLLKKDYNLEKCKSVSHVISSGMLIPSDVFKQVGLMDENLFIDWVDTEWCWRAISKGFSVIQTPHVQIDHCLGNLSKNIIGKTITVHSSFRNYYKIRNAVYLFFYSDSLNVTMKLFALQQIIKMIVVHPLTSDKKILELKIIWNGVIDGIFKKMKSGKL